MPGEFQPLSQLASSVEQPPPAPVPSDNPQQSQPVPGTNPQQPAADTSSQPRQSGVQTLADAHGADIGMAPNPTDAHPVIENVFGQVGGFGEEVVEEEQEDGSASQGQQSMDYSSGDDDN